MMAAIGFIVKRYLACRYAFFIKYNFAIVATFKLFGLPGAGVRKQVFYGIRLRRANYFNNRFGYRLLKYYGHAVAALQVAYQRRMSAGNKA